MSELYFRAGETEGFTSKKLADKREGYSNPIRELLQNSLDASKKAKNKQCEVNIYIENLAKSDIPHIVEYQKALSQAISFHDRAGSYGRNAKQTVNYINSALNQDNLEILMFVDNGIGMSPDTLNGLIGERSVQDDESSGGSFGVGHLSSYFLSSLRYVLYASKYKSRDGINTLFSGSPILAGFEDLDEIPRGSIGRIIEELPKDELKPKYLFPEKFPSFIQPKMDDIDTGSMVTILGLNKSWDKEANYAIVSNFFYAIYKDELTVTVDYGVVENVINKQDIENLLEKQKDRKKALGENILSGQAIYQAWLTVKDKNNEKYIELDNNDKVRIHIRNGIDSDPAIVLIRNGMLIARHDKMLSTDMDNLRKNDNFESFSIVINVDEEDCPILFSLVRGAESPYHNRLERNRLIPKDEKKLKELLKKLSEKIKDEYLEERDRESFSLSMPLLEIPNKAEAQGVNTNRPRSQTPKAKTKPSVPKQPITKIRKTKKGKKRQPPVVINRTLDSTNSVKFEDCGDKFNIMLGITPNKIESRDDVYLSISLAQDNDKNEAGIGLDFIDISIDGINIELADFIEVDKDGVIEKEEANKSQIKLGKLLAGETYNIRAVVRKPEKVQSIGVALKPFFGLKQGVSNDR